MGEITDILKGIPIPSDTMKLLVDKEAEIAVLKAENTNLKATLQKIKTDKTITDYICPSCQTLTGGLLEERDAYPMRQFNQILRFFQCGVCNKEYQKQRQY